MISDEKLKEKLQLSYEICSLYLKTGGSTSDISVATGIPISTVKKQLTMMSKRKEDFLRLLPDLLNEESIELMQSLIDEQIANNIKINKWGPSVSMFEHFKDQIEKIKYLYNKNKQEVSEETKQTIKKMKINGDSFRKIASATGISLATIHKIVNYEISENPSMKKQGKKT